MIIRDMILEDLDKVMELENFTFSIPWSRKSFESEIKTNDLAYYLVVEEEDKIIGYGGIWYIVGEGHITNIAIHSEYRKRGFGIELVKKIIENAKNNDIKDITLEVRVSNISAISLYEKLDFSKEGIRKKYYTDNNEDALIMWLQID